VIQNFDVMGTSATASLPPNWKMSPAGDAAPTYANGGNFTATNLAASSGAPATGGRYNWGNGTATTDRALGFMTSGSYASPNSIMAYYQNTSGVQINDLSITFDYERYRVNAATCAVTFFTSTDGTTWTARTAGDSGAFATGANVYDFTTGTVVSKTVTLIGINVANGGNLYLRWNFNTTGTNSQGVGIDNVSLTATLAPTGITSFQNGPWNNTTTWIGGVIPVSTDNVVINHTVTDATGQTRDAGTTTTVSTSGTLIESNVTYTNNGVTTINGTFQINTGAWATGNNFIYSGTASTLSFNSTSNYGINNLDAYWPVSNSPYNVKVLNSAGITINAGMVRTIAGDLNMGGGITMPTSALTINGTCHVNANGFFSNAPLYGPASTLDYSALATYGRGFEWSALGVGTIGVTPGYPNNVNVSALTTLNYNNGTPLAKAMNGNLTIAPSSTFDMSYGGGTSGGTLTVGGNLSNGGTFILGNTAGDDLKLYGNFTNTVGTFNGNNRAVYFSKASGTQTIISLSPLTIPYIVFDSTGSRTVSASTGALLVSAPLGGNVISFNSSSDIFSIATGITVTLGTAGVANAISGLGTFSGGTISNLTLLGTGSIGTIRFTAGSQNLGTFIVNRTAGAIGCVLGSPLTVSTSLALTNGIVDLGNNPMTIGNSGAISGASANNYIIADVANGSNASLRKNFLSAASFVFPIGDSAASANGSEYSPITATFTGGSYAGYAGFAVNDIKEPNLDAPVHFITRYWDMTSSAITPTNYSLTADYYATDVNGTEALCQSNQWDGSNWSNGGAPGGTNTLTIGGITALPATNHITKGFRAGDLYITDPTPANYATGSLYDFGTKAIGTNTDVIFTIKNVGQQNLTFSLPVLTNTLGTAYSLLPGFSTASLAPNATRTFTIRFSPIAATSYTGKISFTTNDPDEVPYVINFTGIGALPANEINVKSVATGSSIPNNSVVAPVYDTKFAIQLVATTSGTKNYTIENTGNINLNITSFGFDLASANPGDFNITGTPGIILPGGTLSFSITFTPSATGLRTAIVSIGNDDTDENPYLFNIEGTGQGPEINVVGNATSIASGSLTPSTSNFTDFGNVNVTTGSIMRTFTIANVGDASLNITSITKSGAGSADFTISTTATPFSIAASGSTAVNITFDPSVVGARTALITIANNDGDEPSYTFAIEGNGVTYTPCALNVIQTIGQQDFEAAPATPVMLYTPTQDAGAGTIFVGGGQARGEIHTADSNKFIGARSFQIPGNVANTSKNTTLIFDTVDASTYSEVSLNFQLGAYATTDIQGLDVGDKVTVYISTNSGITWSSEMEMSGKSNSIWNVSTSTGSATANYDGNNSPGIFQAPTGSINIGPRNISLSDIPNSAQLRLKIVLTIDRSDELWVLENVKFEGKKPAVSTWFSGSWTPSAPTASVFAIINSAYNTASGNINACSCQINAPVTVNANQYLDIQSDIENNSTVTIESNGSLIQSNDTASNTGTGNYTIKRTTTSYNLYDYTYWSSPVTSATIGATFIGWRTDYAFLFDTASFSDGDLDGFDDNQNDWQQIGTGTTMDPGRGYAVMMPTAGYTGAATTVSFNGNVNNGVVPETLSLSGNVAANDDFNLIGNPYPSAISADDFITANLNFSGTLYFWTHRLGISGGNPGPDMNNFITTDYAMYTLMGGVGTQASGIGSTTPTGFVASGQGFFVEAVTAGDVNFTNSMRRNTGNDNFYRASTIRDEAVEVAQKDRIWLNFENEAGLFSQQLIGYSANATLGFDRGYDGIVSKTENTVSFYSFIGEDECRIQGRPAFDNNDVVPLGYSSNAAGIFTIGIDNREGQLNNPDTQIYLEDKLLNIIHDLKQGAYVFTTGTGTYNNRFVLRYTNTALGTPDFDNIENNVIVAASNGQIRIKSYLETLKKVTVYDISGRQVFQKDNLEGNEFNITDAVLSHQALVVKIALANGQVVNKKIVF